MKQYYKFFVEEKTIPGMEPKRIMGQFYQEDKIKTEPVIALLSEISLENLCNFMNKTMVVRPFNSKDITKVSKKMEISRNEAKELLERYKYVSRIPEHIKK
jgi:hypothetical protein